MDGNGARNSNGGGSQGGGGLDLRRCERDFEIVKTMAHEGSEKTTFWQAVVLFLLLMIAMAVGVTTFMLLKFREDDRYEENYAILSSAVVGVIEARRDSLGQSLASFSAAIDAESRRSGSLGFPFITLPSWESIAAHARLQSPALEVIQWGPMVEGEQSSEWIRYTQSVDARVWYEESSRTALKQQSSEVDRNIENLISGVSFSSSGGVVEPAQFAPFVFLQGPNGPEPSSNPTHAVLWQSSPLPVDPQWINADNAEAYKSLLVAASELGTPVWGPSFATVVDDVSTLGAVATQQNLEFSSNPQRSDPVSKPSVQEQSLDDSTDIFNGGASTEPQPKNDAINIGEKGESPRNSIDNGPYVTILQAVLAPSGAFSSSPSLVGYVAALVNWGTFVQNVAPSGLEGMVCVVRSDCGDVFSYELTDHEAIFLGFQDLQDSGFRDTEVVIPIHFLSSTETDSIQSSSDHCTYTLHLYSSSTLEDQFLSAVPMILTIIVVVGFILVMCIAFSYEGSVSRRNTSVLTAAVQANAQALNLFSIDLSDDDDDRTLKRATPRAFTWTQEGGVRAQMQSFLTKNSSMATLGSDLEYGGQDDFEFSSYPIADVYKDATIAVGEIVGFAEWSSRRRPTDVFLLLESVYKDFDDGIRKRRGVARLETTGDKYMAVTGISEPTPEHAVIMCRFVNDCLSRMRTSLQRLEPKLGADVRDLNVRFGVHSGVVTAGIVRGENARFQVLGHTMQMASTLEMTGVKGKIHLSESTATLLQDRGKDNWIQQRDEQVTAEDGEGLQTWWLNDRLENIAENNESTFSIDEVVQNESKSIEKHQEVMEMLQVNVRILSSMVESIKPLDTSQELESPRFEDEPQPSSPSSVSTTKADVTAEVMNFVLVISSMYNDNPFHGIDRATQVTVQLNNILARVPSDKLGRMTRFACAFATFIHNVDHPGVPNQVLLQEKAHLSSVYQEKYAAEQNAADLGWSLLVDEEYSELQNRLFTNSFNPEHGYSEKEFLRIAVKKLVTATASSTEAISILESTREDEPVESAVNTYDEELRLAIELVRLASHAHRFEPFESYKDWTRRWLLELWVAHKSGRVKEDGTQPFWSSFYAEELTRFDAIVIPLCVRLQGYGLPPLVGSSARDTLNRARQNRNEWQRCGRKFVDDFVAKMSH